MKDILKHKSRRQYNMSVLKITKDNFQNEVMNSDKPVLLDFWASWCGPCKMVGPIVEQVAGETLQTAKVGKVNVDEEPDLAQMFKVMSIPTLVVVNKGEVIKTSVGAKQKAAILDMLNV